MKRLRSPAPPSTPRRPRRWALAGAVLGAALAALAFAPASWLADQVASASQGRLLLAEAQGTLWHGSALPVLSGGPGTRDASVLPSRLHWRIAPFWGGLQLELQQSCCLPQPLTLRWQPGWSGQRLSLDSPGEVAGRWPLAWLEGLGAPLNTLRPAGDLVLGLRQLSLQRGSDGRWQLQGEARIDLQNTSSRLATQDPLGSYRLRLQQSAGGPLQLDLSTLDGALRLSGSGQLGPRGLKFRAEAQAAAGFEAALNNLLNIIGRRDGALSRISIG